MAPVDPPRHDVAAFERRLRSAAQLRRGSARDAELAGILARVGERRSRRTAVDLVGPAGRSGRVRPADAPTGPTPTEGLPPDGAPSPTAGAPDDHDGIGPSAGEARPRTGRAGALERPVPAGAPGEVVEIEAVGTTVRIFRVGRPPGLSFEGGQYVKVGLGGRRGSFSLASAPHESHVELCIELIPGGRLTPQLFAIGPGAQLDIGEQAKGRFTLDRTGSVHLMVATVTGIAPLRSMLRQALHEGTSDRFVILHGASLASELPYHDELAALAASDPRVEYVPTVSRPTEAANAGWVGRTGRVDPLASQVAVTLDRSTTRAYACGHPGMVDTVTSDLRGLGFTVSSETFD